MIHLLLTLSLLAPSTTQSTDRVGAWRDDLQFVAAELPKRHISPFTKISKDQFNAALKALADRVPQLSDTNVVLGLAEAIAAIGDAHTQLSVGPRDARYFTRLPYAFYVFSDGPVIVAATEDHRDLIGCTLESVGGVPFDRAFNECAKLVPWENESHKLNQVPAWMTTPEVIARISDQPTAIGCVKPDGRRFDVKLAPVSLKTPLELVQITDELKGDLPISRRPRTKQENYWFERLDGTSTVYVQYNRCQNDPNRMMLLFAKDLMTFIDEDKIDKVIIDVRNNGGGDSSVLWPVILGIKSRPTINQKGHLFVLIGRRTFSSAQMNAQQFRTQTNAILIGEPTGQKPNSFGEMRTFDLPNSKLTVTYSTKRFNQIADGDPPSTLPDLPVEQSSQDYRAGRDPALDAAIGYAP